MNVNVVKVLLDTPHIYINTMQIPIRELLTREVKRNKTLKDMYAKIPYGTFAYVSLSYDIERAEALLNNGDNNEQEQLHMYDILKRNE